MSKQISLVVLDSGTRRDTSIDQYKTFLSELNLFDSIVTNTNHPDAESDAMNFGLLRRKLLLRVITPWVLMLDTDERLSPELIREITDVMKTPDPSVSGYSIPYQNHFWSKPLKQSAEQYSKVRLFRKDKAKITPVAVHEEIIVSGKIVPLKGRILHYSYRSIGQVIRKFTVYARQIALGKVRRGERITVRKLLLYAPHMFWARYVRSKGYVDGLEGLLLSAGFAYMEEMIYLYLLGFSVLGIPEGDERSR